MYSYIYLFILFLKFKCKCFFFISENSFSISDNAYFILSECCIYQWKKLNYVIEMYYMKIKSQRKHFYHYKNLIPTYWVGVQQVSLTSWGKVPLPPFQWWCHNKNNLRSRSLTFHLFLLGWLKLNLNSFDWLREVNTGGSPDLCWFFSFFGFLKPDLSPWG